MAQPLAKVPAALPPNWSEIAKMPKFRELHRRKASFLIGWWLFSTLFYFGLPIAAGYTTQQTDFWNTKIIGRIPLLYLYALAQYVLCLAIALYYARWANKISDRLTRELVDELKQK